MRVIRPLISYLCVVVFSCFSAYPQQKTAASIPPERDPQALALIQATLAASGGGTTLSNVGEISATGNITFHWANEEVVGTAIVKAGGISRLRLEATVPNGHPTWIVNSGAGRFVDPSGTSHVVPLQDALSFGALLSPLKYLLDVVADNHIGLKYDGLINYGGKQLQEIEIQGHKANSGSSLVLDFRRRVYIDPSSSQIQSIADETWPLGGRSAKILHEIKYSSYQTVQGVVFPFSISDYVGGQDTFDLQLNQISVNSAVVDSDFSLE